jgi:hypothetical protein
VGVSTGLRFPSEVQTKTQPTPRGHRGPSGAGRAARPLGRTPQAGLTLPAPREVRSCREVADRPESPPARRVPSPANRPGHSPTERSGGAAVGEAASRPRARCAERPRPPHPGARPRGAPPPPLARPHSGESAEGRAGCRHLHHALAAAAAAAVARPGSRLRVCLPRHPR